MTKSQLMIFLFLTLFTGCRLFKNTSKSALQNRLDTNDQTYLERSSLKTTNKETNTYTYWNDSSAFQFQNIRENVDEVRRSSLSKEENQSVRQEQLIKKTEPLGLWVYGVFSFVVIGLLVLMFKVCGWVKTENRN